jgi:putative thioredoxin
MHTVPITLENFQSVIIDQSKEKLVLVAFWAEQIPESVELKDKLATAVAPFSDTIILATVDCQEQQQIAMQFGIKGLPTAILVKDSQPLDGVSGPQTDETITEFLSKYLPKVEDEQLKLAKQALTENDFTSAYSFAEQAYQANSERADIKLVLADASIHLGKIEQAEQLLASITMVDQDSDYKAMLAKLELAQEAADSPEIQALEQQLEASPENIELIHQLAAQYSQVNRNEEALALLFNQVRKDSTDATSKQLLLDVMKTLPAGDPLASSYRRKLFSLMY